MSTNIVKGSELQLFYNGNAFAWATSHTLTLGTETSSVSTKDHGLYQSNVVTGLTWEISSENLYSDDDFETLENLWHTAQPIEVAFAKVSNFDTAGLTRAGGTVSAWTPDTQHYRTGTAIISNLTVNAAAGDNATYSITLTGTSALTEYSA